MIRDKDPELVKLIDNEIKLGFTFMETHLLASSQDHASQALSSAKAAFETAERFVERLPADQPNTFRPDLERLRDLIDRA